MINEEQRSTAEDSESKGTSISAELKLELIKKQMIFNEKDIQLSSSIGQGLVVSVPRLY